MQFVDECVIRVVAGDGAIRWCQFSNRALYDDDGQLVEWQSVGRDVTERRQLEAELAQASEQFQDLYDNAPCGYYALDRHGKYVHINQQTLSWLGVGREEVVGKLGVADFFDAEGQALFAKFFPILQETGKIGPLELTLWFLAVGLDATAIATGWGLRVVEPVYTDRGDPESCLATICARLRP